MINSFIRDKWWHLKRLLKYYKIRTWPKYLFYEFGIIKMEKTVYELKNGIKYQVRPTTEDVKIIDEIVLKNDYTPKGFEIQEEDTIIDIGAHIGIFSIYGANVAKKGKVYSFEPHPNNFRMLKNNVKINNMKNIQTYNGVVSNTKLEKELFIIDENEKIMGYETGVSTLISDLSSQGDMNNIKVKSTTLEEIVQKNNIHQIDFLKMDCEGGEYEILLECPNNILNIIKRISMEYHNIDDNKNVNNLIDHLESSGFLISIRKHDKGRGIGLLHGIRN